jgi:hypothetical protein
VCIFKDDVDESDDRLSPQKKKSGATAVGFLQSVKERLSRGIGAFVLCDYSTLFYSGIHTSFISCFGLTGGKRVKTSSRQEKEEQHRSLSADGGDKGTEKRVSMFTVKRTLMFCVVYMSSLYFALPDLGSCALLNELDASVPLCACQLNV